jgi:tetratricopeptide (TPR) repeat protein
VALLAVCLWKLGQSLRSATPGEELVTEPRFSGTLRPAIAAVAVLSLATAVGMGLDDRQRPLHAAGAEVALAADASEESMMWLGVDALYDRRDPIRAAGVFRRILARNPTHYGATFQLAMALDEAGRKDEARPLWEAALRMAEGYNDGPTAATARARLAKQP